MRIIKNRRIIDSQWRHDPRGDDYGANIAEPADYDRIIFPLARWRKLHGTRALAGKTIGVKLRPDDSVREIAAELDSIALIALDFSAFNEGRGYTQATELRRQFHFPGEIRALGAHRDNLALMERCGIDAYQLAEGENLKEALTAFDELTAYYPLSA